MFIRNFTNEQNRIRHAPSPKHFKRCAKLATLVWQLLRSSPSWLAFCGAEDANGNKINGRASYKGANLPIRHLNDTFFSDAHKSGCVGTVYRSTGILSSEAPLILPRNDRAALMAIHDEHVMPVTCVMKVLWSQRDMLTCPRDVFELVHDWHVVAALTKAEQSTGLTSSRTIFGQTRKWGHEHPCLQWDDVSGTLSYRNDTAVVDARDIVLFARYIGTGLEIWNIVTGEPIDTQTYMLRDHLNFLRQDAVAKQTVEAVNQLLG